MNILGLLEMMEWAGRNGEERCCIKCNAWEVYNKKHFQDCELKAAIDALRSGRLRVIEALPTSEEANRVVDGLLREQYRKEKEQGE